MPNEQSEFAQLMVERIQAWRDYRQGLIDEGEHPSTVGKLGKLISTMAKAKNHRGHLRELTAYHFGEGDE